MNDFDIYQEAYRNAKKAAVEQIGISPKDFDRGMRLGATWGVILTGSVLYTAYRISLGVGRRLIR